MKINSFIRLSLYCCLTCYTLTSCTDENNNQDTSNNEKVTKEIQLANQFAKDVLDFYYYWNEEIEKDLKLLDPETNEDPILHHDIFNMNGKKVGYLAYNSFDLKSIERLVRISKEFKAKGVKELILDLRYSGGGYVITENVMASMYVPQAVVYQQRDIRKRVLQ